MSNLWGFHQLWGNRQYMVLGTHLSWSSILVAHCSRHIFPKDTTHSNREITGTKFKTTFGFGHLLWRKTNSKSFEEAAKAFWESFINTQGYFKFSRREFYKSLKDVTAKRLLRRTKILGRPPPGQWRLWGLTSHWTDGPDTGLGRPLKKVLSSERVFVSSYEKTWFKI